MSQKPKHPFITKERQERRIIRRDHLDPQDLPPPLPRHGLVGPRRTFVDPRNRS